MANGWGGLIGGLARARSGFLAGRTQGDQLRQRQENIDAERADAAAERQRRELEDMFTRGHQTRLEGLQREQFNWQQGQASARAKQLAAEKEAAAEQQRAIVKQRIAALRAGGMDPVRAEAVAGDDVAFRSAMTPRERAPAQPSFSHIQLADGSIGAFDQRTGRVVPTGQKGKPPASEQATRSIPPQIVQGVLQNQKQTRVLDDAIAKLEANPNAVGWKTILPDAALNRLPINAGAGGVDARAGIADVGSLEIRDRSGANVTVGEFPRLRPFIPSALDNAETTLKKLKRMRAIIEDETAGLQTAYGPESGFRPMAGVTGGEDPDEAAAREWLTKRRQRGAK